MKLIISTLCLAIGVSWSAAAIDASVSCAVFKSGTQNYAEIYLYIVGSTVKYLPADTTTGNYQAAVEVVILFKQKEQIVKFDKYQLKTIPSKFSTDFIDLKRYALQDGDYDVEVSVTDAHQLKNARTFTQPIHVNFEKNKVQQSDIQLLSNFKADSTSGSALVKNGYALESVPFGFYDKNAFKLAFYHEIYHTDQVIKDDFLLTFGIEKINSGGNQTVLIAHKKRSAKPVDVLFQQVDISQIASGNYLLFIEVRNRAKELLSRKTIAFQRSNPNLNLSLKDTLANETLDKEFVQQLGKDSLRYALKAIAPKLRGDEVQVINTIIANGTLTAQRNFLFRYWTNQAPNQPEFAYKKFMEVAHAADILYKSGFGYGFETDRGSIFIKYGKPDDLISVEDDPSAPPYEIWVYHSFPQTKQTNVKFVFYNPSLAAGDYRTLHSTARGEYNNPRWKVELYRRNAPTETQGGSPFDATEMRGNINRNVSRNFDDL